MKNSQEIKRLLKDISEEINNPIWREYLSDLFTNFEGKFESVSFDEKYKYMSGIDSLFAGMGSLNDGFHSKEVEEKLDKLQFYVNQELIRLWAKLGNETHDLSSIKRYKIGTVVKLIAGKPRYIKLNGSITNFPEQDWVNKSKWKIKCFVDPDITNMPQYLLERPSSDGKRQIVVRHDAIKPINQNLFYRFKSFLN